MELTKTIIKKLKKMNVYKTELLGKKLSKTDKSCGKTDKNSKQRRHKLPISGMKLGLSLQILEWKKDSKGIL